MKIIINRSHKIIIYFTIGIISPFILASASFAEKLYIFLSPFQKTLSVKATILQKTKAYTISEDVDIFHKLEIVYTLLEFRQSMTHKLKGLVIDGTHEEANVSSVSDKYEIRLLLTEIGEYLYHPIQEFIDISTEIEFIITEDLLKYPFDAFYYKKKFLFLQKPITYNFQVHEDNTPFVIQNSWKGLIISDRTSDPERGALLVKALFPQSQYFDTLEVSLKDFKNINNIDFIMISAHGKISTDNEDYMGLNNEQIRPKNLSHLTPKLVYFDSCQLGISRAFIQSFRRSGIKYYIAPILSNEAGNSSTRTMDLFFKALLKGLSPSDALFYTRKELSDMYTLQDDFSTLMWRVFPFRVYCLN